MSLKSLLHQIVDASPAGKLLDIIQGKLFGKLDGKPLDVSPESSGRKLVLKGWVSGNHEVAVKYSANWDNLEKGRIFYQATSAAGFKSTGNNQATTKVAGGKVTLTLKFTDASGKPHNALFSAGLK